MAIFRKIHTQFWSDTFIQTLDPEKRYFFLYLLTNEKTKQCGIYEISKKQISHDTGYNMDTVSILLGYFIFNEKILYSEETNEIAIKNWNKFNGSRSPKVQTLINQEFKSVKNKSLIQYIYSTDRVGILNVQEEQEEEEEEEVERVLTTSAQPEILNSNLFRKPVVPTKQQVWEAISKSGGTKEMAKSFFEKHEATGWFINGSPITNYTALASRFVTNWKSNEESKIKKTETTPTAPTLKKLE